MVGVGGSTSTITQPSSGGGGAGAAAASAATPQHATTYYLGHVAISPAAAAGVVTSSAQNRVPPLNVPIPTSTGPEAPDEFSPLPSPLMSPTVLRAAQALAVLPEARISSPLRSPLAALYTTPAQAQQRPQQQQQQQQGQPGQPQHQPSQQQHQQQILRRGRSPLWVSETTMDAEESEDDQYSRTPAGRYAQLRRYSFTRHSTDELPCRHVGARAVDGIGFVCS